MGVIRGGLFVIASVLFFISLLVGGILWTVSLSLEYNVIKPELSSVIEDVVTDNTNFSEIVEEKLPAMEKYCENNSEFVFSQEGYVVDIPCETFEEGTSAVINETINDIVEDVYYQEYDCGFIQCFKESAGKPFFLISEMAKNYWRNKLYIVLTLSFIILILMFLLIENKTNLPLVVGPLLVITSLFFTKLDWISSFTSEKILLQIISVFFTQSLGVFWRFFIAGILVLIAGVFIKLFGIGFGISNFIEKIHGENKGAKEKNLVKDPKIQKKMKVGIKK
ncbi:MAG: hypothetical protein KKF67_01890 [Nanoarchaeota archaeon]|nr:hypothetical protein [Nanoarchaeota archaeon]